MRYPHYFNDNKSHILVINEHLLSTNSFKDVLIENGFRVSLASDLQSVRQKLSLILFDLIVIDVKKLCPFYYDLLPLLQKVVSSQFCIVCDIEQRRLILSNSSEIFSDQFILKPCDAPNLMMKIRDILRLKRLKAKRPVDKVSFGPYVFHISNCQLIKNGQLVKLTSREEDIMRIFAQRFGEDVPRYDFLPKNSSTSERTIDVQINALRSKVEKNPSHPLWLQTVRGVGYRLIDHSIKRSLKAS